MVAGNFGKNRRGRRKAGRVGAVPSLPAAVAFARCGDRFQSLLLGSRGMLLAILAVPRLVFEEVQVTARLTHPSSGRAAAGFAHRVPPLMSNVRLAFTDEGRGRS